MKILHILSSNIYSGAENVVCQIIKMTKDIPEIQMVYSSPDGTIRLALEERDISYASMRRMRISDVKKVITEQNPDIIHAHDMRACFLTSLVCGNIPLICHIHNNAVDSRGISIKSVLFMHAAKKAKHIFWVSESSFRGYAFHDYCKEKSSILFNIIDIQSLYKSMKTNPDTYDYDVLFIGRMVYQKNPQRFVEIIKKLSDRVPTVKACMIGDGEEKEKLERVANIECLGFVNNPARLIHDSRVLLMTSRWEGTPMSALEAMALGTPIVSTPVDGMIQIIENNENGFISDDDEEIISKVYEIISNRKLREKMSKAQIEKSKSINDIDNYRNEILTVYEQCANP